VEEEKWKGLKGIKKKKKIKLKQKGEIKEIKIKKI
jgi:hypothetical protein